MNLHYTLTYLEKPPKSAEQEVIRQSNENYMSPDKQNITY